MNSVLFAAVIISFLSCLAHGKVTIKRFEMCELEPNKEYRITFSQTLKTEGDMQVVEDGRLNSTVDMGDNIKIFVDVKALESDGKYHQVVQASEHLCTVLRNYLGDFGHELQKASGVEPGTCPIPKGAYEVKNHLLDFTKFKYQNVPKGELKIRSEMYDEELSEIVGCLEAELLLE